ncbi:u3 small nucleolar RNA-associated protein 15 [Pelomyxa schiedti]|nr:u3 small nucleolar RNA-associated protein 15 [Pelomyxa schiedti]KAH3743592.1 u3 small nucleolar RNA-associated protein 15 [Pelomyxa schiedti]
MSRLSYVPPEKKRVGTKVSEEDPEKLYWGRYKAVGTVPVDGPVSSIVMSPKYSSCPEILVTANLPHVIDLQSYSIAKSFTKFRETALGASYRSDGKMIACGGTYPAVKIFQATTLGLLRTFRGHKAPVRATGFLSDNVTVVSAAEDGVVKTWDMATGNNITTTQAHSDHVRQLLTSPKDNTFWATASYDQTIKLWDLRQKSNVMTMKHASPVESIIFFPGGNIIASAGGTSVKIWDLLNGGSQQRTLSGNHLKTITSLGISSDSSRLFSGGLDEHIKVYNVSSWTVAHTFSYPSPILSLGFSPDDKTLVVGGSDGKLHIQQQTDETAVTPAPQPSELPTKRYWKPAPSRPTAQRNYQPPDHITKYFQMLQHPKALDAALEVYSEQHEPLAVMSTLQELLRRGRLVEAVGSRDDDSLAPIVMFLCENIDTPAFTNTLVAITHVILDIYTDHLQGSPMIEHLLEKLFSKVKTEIRLEDTMMELLGSLSLIVSSGTQSNPISTSASSS